MIKEHDKSNDFMNVVEDKNSVIEVKDNKLEKNKTINKQNIGKEIKNDNKKKDDCNIL